MSGIRRATMMEWNVNHPPGITPEDLLTFVYLDEFEDDWKQLHPNDADEESLWALEVAIDIMMAPSKAPVISGTGGLRKLRFVEEGSNRGTSGGLRVCYAYFPEHNTVLMVIAFDKHEQSTLSSDEKKSIKRVIAFIDSLLTEKSKDKQKQDGA